MTAGIFDFEFRERKLDRNGDPLAQLNKTIPWEEFRAELETIRSKERKSNAGRRPYDVVLMFKILVLQSLYNLSDDATEFQILDRLSFMRFLGLDLGDAVPDAKTIWLFREQLKEERRVERLFERFDTYLREHGFAARKGQIIDATIVEVPRQRNSREENATIKQGETPEGWSEARKRQKDTDARWVQKNGQNHYGYKNHVSVDVEHKLIRKWDVSDAALHDSQVFEVLLDETNSSRAVWADSAYRSTEHIDLLKERGFRERMQRKGCRNRKLTQREKQGNRTRSKIRSRVEHVFGLQAQRAGNLVLRTIGQARARAKIGLRNLAFNLTRYVFLTRAAA